MSSSKGFSSSYASEGSETKTKHKKLKDSIDEKLNELGNPLSEEPCIYRVPKRLRAVNASAYTPRLVSIGPLHHGDENLTQMEAQKFRSLSNFIARPEICGCGGKMDEMITYIKNVKQNIRNCYAEKIGILESKDSDSYTKMVLLDAIFIIELFKNGCMTNDEVFVRKEDIDKDLILLENQLPFFILEELYNLAFGTCSENFKSLTLKYFKSKNKQDKSFPQDVKHFTDLLRKFLLPDESPQESKSFKEKCLHYICWPEATDQANASNKSRQVYSATELRESGVKFESCKEKCLLSIEFTDGGKLKMPCLEINDETESFFRNLMALEQCHYASEAKTICDYILFMDFLINTAKDVELLVGKEIIENWLGDHGAVANLLNNLSLEIIVGKTRFFDDCITRLNEYYNVRCHSWKATLRHYYFSTPMTGASTTAAIIILALTTAQTVCSFISLK